MPQLQKAPSTVSISTREVFQRPARNNSDLVGVNWKYRHQHAAQYYRDAAKLRIGSKENCSVKTVLYCVCES